MPVRSSAGTEKPAFVLKDVSFSIPQRKKLHLEVLAVDDTRAKMEYLLRARNTTSNDIEFEVPLRSYSKIL